MIAAGNYAGALRDHLQPVLERDPENAAALELKRQADRSERCAARAAKPKPPVPKPEGRRRSRDAGIARKPGEGDTRIHRARRRAFRSTWPRARPLSTRGITRVALARFRLVDRDAPKYQGVDALIADTTAKQQKAVDTAIDSGQQNETGRQADDARRWYEQALQHNPSSVVAREKRAAVISKMNQAAADDLQPGHRGLKLAEHARPSVFSRRSSTRPMPGDEYPGKSRQTAGVDEEMSSRLSLWQRRPSPPSWRHCSCARSRAALSAAQFKWMVGRTRTSSTRRSRIRPAASRSNIPRRTGSGCRAADRVSRLRPQRWADAVSSITSGWSTPLTPAEIGGHAGGGAQHAQGSAAKGEGLQVRHARQQGRPRRADPVLARGDRPGDGHPVSRLPSARNCFASTASSPTSSWRSTNRSSCT